MVMHLLRASRVKQKKTCLNIASKEINTYVHTLQHGNMGVNISPFRKKLDYLIQMLHTLLDSNRICD